MDGINDIKTFEALKAFVILVLAENERLRARIAELEAQLKINSNNSHQAPSQDKPQDKAPVKSGLPKPEGKCKGGQAGHKGNTLKMTDNSDVITLCVPSVCVCGASLENVAGSVIESRQVFDLPEPRLEVIQFNRLEKICRCGCRNTGTFPDCAKAPVQYGEGVSAFIALLSNGFHLSCDKIGELFNDLYGYELNAATVLNHNKRCYELLANTENSIKAALLAAPVVHFDETGLNHTPKPIWLHSAGTAKLIFQFVHANRGLQAVKDEQSLLPHFTGRAVHDCWSHYFSFTDCLHAVCGAHLLRELTGLIENGSKWAHSFHKLLCAMYRASEKGTSVLRHFERWENIYIDICERAEKEEPPPKRTSEKQGKLKRTKGRNLLERLIKYKSSVLAFARYDRVPFTNNQAERDVRPCKGKIKIAGVFRTMDGAKQFARTQAFISTVRKQNLNTFKELKKVFSIKNYTIVLST